MPGIRRSIRIDVRFRLAHENQRAFSGIRFTDDQRSLLRRRACA